MKKRNVTKEKDSQKKSFPRTKPADAAFFGKLGFYRGEDVIVLF